MYIVPLYLYGDIHRYIRGPKRISNYVQFNTVSRVGTSFATGIYKVLIIFKEKQSASRASYGGARFHFTEVDCWSIPSHRRDAHLRYSRIGMSSENSPLETSFQWWALQILKFENDGRVSSFNSFFWWGAISLFDLSPLLFLDRSYRSSSLTQCFVLCSFVCL